MTNSGAKSNDLRNARLSLPAGPATGAAQAFRKHHHEALAEARHQAGRLLHHADRRVQSGADLFPRLGLARRPREEVGGLPERSGLDLRARQDRGGWPDRRQHRQPAFGADRILVGEVRPNCRTASITSFTPSATSTRPARCIASSASPWACATATTGARII